MRATGENHGIPDIRMPSDDLAEIRKHCLPESCSEPKVSVIVPAYNTEKFIRRCLHSLVRQSLKEIEIIVVNDGSTDSTAEKIREIAGFDRRVKVISQNNQKQGAARNRGMKAASGEYLGFVDSDDWVNDNYFEKLYSAAKKYDSDIALAVNVRVGNGRTKKRLDIDREALALSLQERIDISGQAANPCPTNKIYRHRWLLEHKIFYPEGVYCEDKLFTIRALYHANALAAVPGTFYCYFRNPQSTVYRRSKKMIMHKNAANSAVLQFLKMQNAAVRDREFWAVIREFRVIGTVIFRYEESLRSKRISLFGLKLLNWTIREEF